MTSSKEIGSLGGQSTRENYGSDYYSAIGKLGGKAKRKKKREDDLDISMETARSKGGRRRAEKYDAEVRKKYSSKGGNKTFEKYGSEYMEEIGAIGGNNTLKRGKNHYSNLGKRSRGVE